MVSQLLGFVLRRLDFLLAQAGDIGDVVDSELALQHSPGRFELVADRRDVPKPVFRQLGEMNLEMVGQDVLRRIHLRDLGTTMIAG